MEKQISNQTPSIDIAYDEMARVCALILNVIATDIEDDGTVVHRFNERREVSKDEAHEICTLTHDFLEHGKVNSVDHTKNVLFFKDLLERLCACPPEKIQWHGAIESFFARL